MFESVKKICNYPVQKKSKKDLTGFCDKNGTHGCKLNHV